MKLIFFSFGSARFGWCVSFGLFANADVDIDAIAGAGANAA